MINANVRFPHTVLGIHAAARLFYLTHVSIPLLYILYPNTLRGSKSPEGLKVAERISSRDECQRDSITPSASQPAAILPKDLCLSSFVIYAYIPQPAKLVPRPFTKLFVPRTTLRDTPSHR